MNEWYPEEEEDGDDKGMVHLKVVWEEVAFFFFFFKLLTDVSYWRFFIWKYMKKVKKINYYIELLCIIRSFLLNNLVLLLYQSDCIRCGEAYTIQVSVIAQSMLPSAHFHCSVAQLGS